jgi:hypothetical protein
MGNEWLCFGLGALAQVPSAERLWAPCQGRLVAAVLIACALLLPLLEHAVQLCWLPCAVQVAPLGCCSTRQSILSCQAGARLVRP